jgi:hypothetical protein
MGRGSPVGREIDLYEAVRRFEMLPSQLRMGTLDPRFVAEDAHRDSSLRNVHFLYEEEQQFFLHSFHLGAIPGAELRDIQSAYGYGGPLASASDPAFLERADRSFRAWAGEQSVAAEFLRFHPAADNRHFYLGPTREDRDTVSIDLREDLFGQYQSRRRSYVRSALRGPLRCEFVDSRTMLERFPSIYAQNMTALGATPFYFFSRDYFERILGLDFVRGILAYDEAGQTIAGLILAVCSGNVEYHLAAALPDAPTLATTLLIHSVAAHYQQAGASLFYLGGGRSSDPKDSLLFFKRSFSRGTRRFCIGPRVLDPSSYQRLQTLFCERFAANPGRVLFYR